VHLTGTDECTVQLWIDDSYPVVEIFTHDMPTQRVPDR
jgi:hypothetical protein